MWAKTLPIALLVYVCNKLISIIITLCNLLVYTSWSSDDLLIFNCEWLLLVLDGVVVKLCLLPLTNWLFLTGKLLVLLWVDSDFDLSDFDCIVWIVGRSFMGSSFSRPESSSILWGWHCTSAHTTCYAVSITFSLLLHWHVLFGTSH